MRGDGKDGEGPQSNFQKGIEGYVIHSQTANKCNMTDTPIVRIAELEIDPDQINAYIALLREEIEASIAFEPGVLALNAVSLKNNPTSIRLLEIYASEQAYQSHLQSPHFLKYKTLTAEMVMSLQLVETEPLLLRNKAM
jgi:quinol monooxygenase YgiN